MGAQTQRSPAASPLASPSENSEEEAGRGPEMGIGPPATLSAADPELRRGRCFGRYELREHLGQGGMGTVWKAWDPVVGRMVALKVLRSDGAAPAESRARFLREARLAARLRHDGIVRLHDIGEESGRAYLTMDLVEGRTLAAWLDETSAARRSGGAGAYGPLREQVEALASVAEAVAAAHEAGVIHRDLKPGNVLLNREGRAQVGDFGLAKEATSRDGGSDPGSDTGITIGGTTLGTPDYMSPEQAAGRLDQVGKASDVWALGVMLHEILAGELPFRGATVWELLQAIQSDDPRSASRGRGQVPPELEAVSRSALEKDPARRVPGAREFAAELRRWLRGEPVHTRTPGWARRGWRALVRRRGAAVGAATVLVAALVAGAWAGWSTSRERDRARAILREVAAAVAGLESAVLSTPAPPEARRALAAQPLGMLERIVAGDPEFGPAYSWRGRVREILGDPGFEEDYDRGVARSPEWSVVWRLRGISLLLRYGESRGQPTVVTGSTGVHFEPMRPQTSEETAWRTRGLADLDQMAHRMAGEGEESQEAHRLGAAMAALHSGRPDGAETAHFLLEGVPGPRAGRLRALAQYLRKRFRQAVQEFDAVLDAWPEDVESRLHRSEAHFACAVEAIATLRDPGAALVRAREDCEAVLSRRPGWSQAISARGRVRVLEGETSVLGGRDPEEALRAAIDDFNRVLEAHPAVASWLTARATAWETLATARHVRGREAESCYRQAIADFGAALELEPESPVAWNNRGNAWKGLGEMERDRGGDPRESYRKAIDDLDRAVALAPRDGEARTNRGGARRSLAEACAVRGIDPLEVLLAAIEDLDAAVALVPESLNAYNNRGNAQVAMARALAARGGDPRPSLRLAVADFDQVVRRDPEFITAYSNRGLALFRLAEREEADGADPRARYAAAIADFGETVKRSPELFGVYVNRGLARRALARAQAARGEDAVGTLRDAVADYGEALARRPELAAAHDGRGRAWLALAETQEAQRQDPRVAFAAAEEDFRESVRSAPDQAPGWLTCGAVTLRRADAESTRAGDAEPVYRRAIADLDEALRLEPRLDAAVEERGTAWRGLGAARFAKGEDPSAEFEAAAQDFSELIARRPDEGRPYNLRGSVQIRRADAERVRGGEVDLWYRAAESDYYSAVERMEYEGYLNLGLLYGMWGRMEDAITALEAGARSVPGAREWAETRIAEFRRRLEDERK